jgi:hypothetical protein
LAGLVIDDQAAKKTGDWTSGAGLEGFVGGNYLYNNGPGNVRFEFAAPATGLHEIRLAYQPHQNRGDRVRVTVDQAGQVTESRINMQVKLPLKNGFISLGKFEFSSGDSVAVTLWTEDAGGLVHADALQVLPSK